MVILNGDTAHDNGGYYFYRPSEDFFSFMLNEKELHSEITVNIKDTGRTYEIMTKYYDRIYIEADNDMLLK